MFLSTKRALFAIALSLSLSAAAQTAPSPGIIPLQSASPYRMIVPAVQPSISPGELTLIELETRFAASVAEGGGKAFATWFAEDAVALNNGKPATLGRGAIAANANWDPKQYALTWTPEGARMGPSNDMGFTWGRYIGRSISSAGATVTSTGRYMTVWKKTKDGTWKVAMDASANEPADEAACCTPPKP